MRLLFDTHALIWWMADDRNLPGPVRAAIDADGNELFASAANAFEIAIKHRLGKLAVADGFSDSYEQSLREAGIEELPVTTAHALLAGRLDFAHADPFDRLIVAQAIAEDMTLVSNERRFDATGVTRLWD